MEPGCHELCQPVFEPLAGALSSEMDDVISSENRGHQLSLGTIMGQTSQAETTSRLLLPNAQCVHQKVKLASNNHRVAPCLGCR